MSSTSGPNAFGPRPMPFSPAATSAQIADSPKTKEIALSVFQQSTPETSDHPEHKITLLSEVSDITQASSSTFHLTLDPQEVDPSRNFEQLMKSDHVDDIIKGIEFFATQGRDHQMQVFKLEDHLMNTLQTMRPNADTLQKGIACLIKQQYSGRNPSALTELQQLLYLHLEDRSRDIFFPIPIEQLKQGIVFFQTHHENQYANFLLRNLYEHPHLSSLNAHDLINTIQFCIKHDGGQSHNVGVLQSYLYTILCNPHTSASEILTGIHFFAGRVEANTLQGRLYDRLMSSNASLSELLEGTKLFIQQDKNSHQSRMLSDVLYKKLCFPSNNPLERDSQTEGKQFLKETYGEIRHYTTTFIDHELLLQEQPKDVTARMSFAEKHWQEHPERLADQLFRLFTVQEINENPSFFDPLIQKTLDSNTPNHSYLVHHKMYIDHSRKLQTSSSSAKSCHHWECLGEDPQHSGCLVFRLKDKHDALALGASSLGKNIVIDENVKISPAVEPTLEDLADSESVDFNAPHFQLLGFRCEKDVNGVYLVIPTTEELHRRWSILQQARPGLPAFICENSQGIATSKEFVALHRTGDVVVSTEEEFLHDMFVHCMASIEALLENPDEYLRVQNDLRKLGWVAEAAEASDHYNTPLERAKVQLLGELVAILHDLTTAQNDRDDRTESIEDWNSGQYSAVISTKEWVPRLQTNSALNDCLTLLQITPKREWPAKELKKMWEIMVANYNHDQAKTAG